MFDIKASQISQINKLKEWRERYSKNDYPGKVILNLFYELFTIELIWDEINLAFSGEIQFSDPAQAFSHIVEIKRQVQLREVHADLERLMANDTIACGVKYSDFQGMIENAINGDNGSVVEVEYSYWYYCQYYEAIIEWAACGYLGYDKHSAFQAVTGGDVGGLKLDTFENTVEFFHKLLGISFSWKDADGNSINPLSEEDKNKKYYSDSFEILSPLWDKTSKVKNKSGCFVATTVYGDSNAPEVVKLRNFRNEVLYKTILGNCAITIYFLFGSLLAKFVTFFKMKKQVRKLLDLEFNY